MLSGAWSLPIREGVDFFLNLNSDTLLPTPER